MITISRKKEAKNYLDKLVKAQNIMRTAFPINEFRTLKPIISNNHIQFGNDLAEWCKLLDIQYTREYWDGNETCNSNWDILYFDYHGYRFFQLTDAEKEESNDGE